jgi:hypothetical protein
MPFCPKCRNQYVDGTRVCEDCGVDLVDSLSDESPSTGGELVEVWHTQGEMDAQLIRSMLESNGIHAVLSGESLRLTHGLTVDGLAEVRILVRDDDAKRACEIIASLDGMTRCGNCGYPVYQSDTTCHSCGEPLGS